MYNFSFFSVSRSSYLLHSVSSSYSSFSYVNLPCFILLSFLVWPLLPNLCRYRWLLLRLITLMTLTLGRTTQEEGSARRKDLYLTTHNSHKRKNIHAPGGIRTRNPSKLAAADPRLRPHGRRNRRLLLLWLTICKFRLSSSCNFSFYQFAVFICIHAPSVSPAFDCYYFGTHFSGTLSLLHNEVTSLDQLRMDNNSIAVGYSL